MKYAIIIADGGADFAISELGGRTPLQAAHMPNLRNLTEPEAPGFAARVGACVTSPPGWAAGSDVCSMCLLGYDPVRYHTGRAPLEAAAMGILLTGCDWIFRVNLVTVGEEGTSDAGLMLDHSAGAIRAEDARRIVPDLMAHWRSREPALCGGMRLYPGVSYRNILVDSSGSRSYAGLSNAPPHEIPLRPWREHLPTPIGQGADAASAGALRRLVELSREVLPGHPVNRERAMRGERPANLAWIWGQGTKPDMPDFGEHYGLAGGGAMTTAVDLLAGIASLIGWEKLDVPGATSYHDNDYAGQGRATVEALRAGRGIVCCHVESPDEASHQGDWRTKVAALEAIDRDVIGPVAGALSGFADWRLLLMPDHYTLVSTRKHDNTPPPFLIAGGGRGAPRWGEGSGLRFDEPSANASPLRIEPGHRLMDLFVKG